MTKDVITTKPFRMRDGSIADAIDMATWEEENDELRELQMPVIRMVGGGRARALQVCEIQNSV